MYNTTLEMICVKKYMSSYNTVQFREQGKEKGTQRKHINTPLAPLNDIQHIRTPNL